MAPADKGTNTAIRRLILACRGIEKLLHTRVPTKLRVPLTPSVDTLNHSSHVAPLSSNTQLAQPTDGGFENGALVAVFDGHRGQSSKSAPWIINLNAVDGSVDDVRFSGCPICRLNGQFDHYGTNPCIARTAG